MATVTPWTAHATLPASCTFASLQSLWEEIASKTDSPVSTSTHDGQQLVRAGNVAWVMMVTQAREAHRLTMAQTATIMAFAEFWAALAVCRWGPGRFVKSDAEKWGIAKELCNDWDTLMASEVAPPDDNGDPLVGTDTTVTDQRAPEWWVGDGATDWPDNKKRSAARADDQWIDFIPDMEGVPRRDGSD